MYERGKIHCWFLQGILALKTHGGFKTEVFIHGGVQAYRMLNEYHQWRMIIVVEVESSVRDLKVPSLIPDEVVDVHWLWIP